MDQQAHATAFDRTQEDVGNIVELGHVNTRVPDQRLATLFYISGLGLTRDPYLMTGIDNMWVNVGRSQFHLPTGGTQVLGGRTGLVVPDLEALLRRLSSVRRHLENTRFSFREQGDHVEATCPWGNRITCHAPSRRFGPIDLGMAYIVFDVPQGSADGIARFYRDVMQAPASLTQHEGAPAAHVPVGIGHWLLFREVAETLPPFDGAHIQISLADFSGPYRRLLERGLITEESDQHQYRFQTIVDPDSSAPLFMVEHEVRSMRHPLYARPLVNRNPGQTNQRYAPGHDAWAWERCRRIDSPSYRQRRVGLHLVQHEKRAHLAHAGKRDDPLAVEPVERGDILHAHLQEVIDLSSHQEAFHHLRQRAGGALELRETFPGGAVQHHAHYHDRLLPHGARIDHRAHPADDAGLEQPACTRPAGGFAQMDALRQGRIAQPAVHLQHRQDAAIGGIQWCAILGRRSF